MSERVLVIPADENQPIKEATLESIGYQTLGSLLAEYHGGKCWIEQVHTSLMIELTEGITGNREPWIAMIVDEEGVLKNLPDNLRASVLYRGKLSDFEPRIYGTAILIMERRDPMEGLVWQGVHLDINAQNVRQWIEGV